MDEIATAKLALRDQLVTARGRLSISDLAARARTLAQVMTQMPEVRRAATVACYVSVGREPGTGPLIEALSASGKHVLLPLLRADNDLDWAPYSGADMLLSAGRGLLEPTTEPLGVDAVARADVVVVPGLAIDRTGMRMGRGGGSYDRALGRVPVGTPVVCLLNASEILDRIPVAAHDRPVTAVATEQGLLRLRRPGR